MKQIDRASSVYYVSIIWKQKQKIKQRQQRRRRMKWRPKRREMEMGIRTYIDGDRKLEKSEKRHTKIDKKSN